RIASQLLEIEPQAICLRAGTPLLLAPSIKAGLDIDWSDPKQKAAAIEVVERQVGSLERWVDQHLKAIAKPLTPYLEPLTVVRAQDREPTPQGGVQIRQGVAPDRRISIEDAEMRHGRKSKTKRFDGYKELQRRPWTDPPGDAFVIHRAAPG